MKWRSDCQTCCHYSESAMAFFPAHDAMRETSELKSRALQWCKTNEKHPSQVQWSRRPDRQPTAADCASGGQRVALGADRTPSRSWQSNWDHGGTGELGVFYRNEDADAMDLICDVFNWAIEQLAPSEQDFYGSRTYQ